jgi:hypothetical protein
MRRKLPLLAALAAAVVVVAVVFAGAGAAVAPNETIRLNNATATQGTDCPATGTYWHFVINPNNGDSQFITFHLNLGDATTYDTSTFVPNGSQLDNVFVAVPSGKTLTSLQVGTGDPGDPLSTADIFWNGSNPQPTKFELSHTCNGKASPSITTVASPTTGKAGQQLTVGDTATIVNGNSPTGSVTFTLYSDSACTLPVGGVVSGSGTISSGSASFSTSWTPAAAGTYYWIASYPGDANNNGFTTGCGDNNEQIVISKSSPSITTKAASTGLAPNIMVSDTATLHDFGTPVGGTVTFNLYGPNDSTCAGPVAFTDTENVASDGTATSASFKLLKPGTYSWEASYSGDTNVNNSAGFTACNDAAETYEFDQATSSVVTTVKGVDSTGHVALGASGVYDEATITPSNATGSVTFTLYKGPFTGTPPDCTTGTKVGTPETITPLPAGDVVDSTPLSNIGAGDYAYQAVYTSDSPFFTSVTGDCEPFTVNKADTTSNTTIVREDTGGKLAISPEPHVPLNTTVHDTATVGTQVGNFAITGTVTYHFYTGDGCVAANEVGTGEGVTINGDGSVPNSSSHGPLGAGSYSFNASYGGNDNYNASGLSACEPLVVDKASTNASTAVVRDDTGATVPQNGNVPVGTSVHDTATVGTQVGNFVISGTVTYHFYASADCSTGEFGTLNGHTWPQTVTIDNTGAVPNSQSTGSLSGGGYGFEAVYSGDSNYKTSTGSCESFTVRTFGKTMGFWGNNNGQALLAADNAFSTTPPPGNAVALGISGGCYVVVDSATKSLQILPNTLNGITLTGCSSNLDNGINTNSFNVMLAQTLALSYNNLWKSGFAGQTIGGMGCTAPTGLSSTSTTQQVQAYANGLIGNAKKNYGTTVTQSQIGALNTLLGCMNSEA